MTHKYVCIHGHFYQPPRESPWSDEIEPQPSAGPYHDWNERITDECYWQNARAKILNGDVGAEKIVNNYEKISFNFGPTLLFWMKSKYPALLRSIVEADEASRLQFHGHGNAIAQAYNHLIMPLANTQDKITELHWGIQDFEYYFNRKPEGLWLPETAVDLESLDLMSGMGIKFTILAPRQVMRVRPLLGGEWSDQFSTGMPYLQRLPSGRTIILFFYDGGISQAVAFERLLTDGGQFAKRLIEATPDSRPQNTLSHIATDGETYGHHHRFGDMSLAYAIQCLEATNDIEITNYGHYIEIQSPDYEVEIHQNSSWSCEHGIERWRSNCGCNSGAHPDWNQNWRGPLRDALDWLRDTLSPIYESEQGLYLKDPWLARNDYITVINNRYRFNEFIQTHAIRSLNHQEKMRVLKWCELQRYALLMYTSCGWFFDEISGLETVQILRYAGRVIQLAKALTSIHYETGFLEHLARAPSNLPDFPDGAAIYKHFVGPFINGP